MKEYRLTGKGNIEGRVSLGFLILTKGSEVEAYSGRRNKCEISSGKLDASAIYFQNKQRLTVTGKDAQEFAEFLEKELNKIKIKLTPIKNVS